MCKNQKRKKDNLQSRDEKTILKEYLQKAQERSNALKKLMREIDKNINKDLI